MTTHEDISFSTFLLVILLVVGVVVAFSTWADPMWLYPGDPADIHFWPSDPYPLPEQGPSLPSPFVDQSPPITT